jgi:hypothetical protein
MLSVWKKRYVCFIAVSLETFYFEIKGCLGLEAQQTDIHGPKEKILIQ